MKTEMIGTIQDLICQADAVLVGAGSGMSSAAGYNHYHRNEVFETYFHDFEEVYGIRNLFQGFYYVYSKPEQQWGFIPATSGLWKKRLQASHIVTSMRF